MNHPKKHNLAGTFHTVEDLMNLPEAGTVDPRKGSEVSRDVPVRFWMNKEELITLLANNVEVLEANKEVAPTAEAAQADILIAQRMLWMQYLGSLEDEDIYIGLYPASTAGEQYDHEEAVMVA